MGFSSMKRNGESRPLLAGLGDLIHLAATIMLENSWVRPLLQLAQKVKKRVLVIPFMKEGNPKFGGIIS